MIDIEYTQVFFVSKRVFSSKLYSTIKTKIMMLFHAR